MSVFGAITDGSDVEFIVEKFLRRWLPTYLAEMAGQRGLPRDSFPPPQSWTHSTEFNLDETTQLPAILIICSGLAGDPTRHGDGSYSVSWVIGVGVIVSAGGDDPHNATNKLAKRYGAAIRWAMTQNPALEDSRIAGLSWDDEGYDDVPSGQARSLASARLVFTIQVDDVMNDMDGPVLPDDPPPDPTIPYADWPLVRDPDSDPPYIPVTVTRSP